MPASGHPDTRARWSIRLALVLFCLAQPLHATQPSLCPSDRFDEEARVRFVNDGDTLTLRDGRKVRLIGLNAPEIPHGDTPGEPGGIRARNHLRKLVRMNGQRVRLRYDAERQDRHGRTLAHLYSKDGASLAAVLIAAGDAFAVTVPPNLWQAECLHRLDRQAREAHRGVWKLPFWKPLYADRADDFRSLRPGFRRLRGKVRSVARFDAGTRIRLSNRAQLWIPARQRQYFRKEPPERWMGRRIEARGWIYPRRGIWQMTLTHPLNLDLQARTLNERPTRPAPPSP